MLPTCICSSIATSGHVHACTCTNWERCFQEHLELELMHLSLSLPPLSLSPTDLLCFSVPLFLCPPSPLQWLIWPHLSLEVWPPLPFPCFRSFVVVQHLVHILAGADSCPLYLPSHLHVVTITTSKDNFGNHTSPGKCCLLHVQPDMLILLVAALGPAICHVPVNHKLVVRPSLWGESLERTL